MNKINILITLAVVISLLLVIFYSLGEKETPKIAKKERDYENDFALDYKIKCSIKLKQITEIELSTTKIREAFVRSVISISGEEIEERNISDIVVTSSIEEVDVVVVKFNIYVSSKESARRIVETLNYRMEENSDEGFIYIFRSHLNKRGYELDPIINNFIAEDVNIYNDTKYGIDNSYNSVDNSQTINEQQNLDYESNFYSNNQQQYINNNEINQQQYINNNELNQRYQQQNIDSNNRIYNNEIQGNTTNQNITNVEQNIIGNQQYTGMNERNQLMNEALLKKNMEEEKKMRQYLTQEEDRMYYLAEEEKERMQQLVQEEEERMQHIAEEEEIRKHMEEEQKKQKELEKHLAEEEEKHHGEEEEIYHAEEEYRKHLEEEENKKQKEEQEEEYYAEEELLKEKQMLDKHLVEEEINLQNKYQGSEEGDKRVRDQYQEEESEIHQRYKDSINKLHQKYNKNIPSEYEEQLYSSFSKGDHTKNKSVDLINKENWDKYVLQEASKKDDNIFNIIYNSIVIPEHDH